MKKRIVAVFLALCMAGSMSVAAQEPEGALPSLRTGHEKYMDGYGDGFFYPDGYLTRSQAAQLVYNCLDGDAVATEGGSFVDVPADAWYAPAVNTLGSLGVVTQDQTGRFRPDDLISRGEFSMMLAPFSNAQAGENPFPDVNDQQVAYQSILITYAAGVFRGWGDGRFYPGSPLTRAEAATCMARLLGRSPDANQIRRDMPSLFPDVTLDHWAYAYIMEATTSHSAELTENGTEHWVSWQEAQTPLADGFYRFGGRLYCVASGRFLRNTTVDGFTFDASGRYTTGLSELDEVLNGLVETYSDPTRSREGNLRVLYEYIRDHFTYLKRAIYGKATGWEPEAAQLFCETGKGNCYSFSALFTLLARELGYPAKTVPGYLGKNLQDHCWVVIPENGVDYMYDPQLEWRYLHDRGQSGYDLFKMSPANTPFAYTPM